MYFIQVPGEPEYELFAGSENHFHLPKSDLEITFYRNDRGEADRGMGVVGGVMYEAKRRPNRRMDQSHLNTTQLYGAK
jgi:hypothetical protein